MGKRNKPWGQGEGGAQERRRAPRWALGAALAAALTVGGLAACAVGPDYERPSAETPSAYKEAQAWKQAEPRDQAARGAWWRVYGDPRLDALTEQVSLSNLNLAAAEARLRQAQALIRFARASFFPAAIAAPSHTAFMKSQNTASGPTAGGVEGTDYYLPLQISWELDLWGRIRRNVEANQTAAEATAADLEAARLSAQADLVQAYYQLRTLDAQKRLLDDTSVSYEEFLELTRRRQRAGVASMADVAQAETQLKSAQALALDATVQRAQLEHAVAVLIGKPPAGFSLPFMPDPVTVPAIPVGLPSELLERRPDIAAAERRVASANAQIGVATAAFYPTLTLGAAGGYESSSLDRLLDWPSRFWSVGPSITAAIFDGGLRRAQLEGTRAAYEAGVAAYRQTVLSAFKEVEDNLAALRILEQEARVQGEAVEAARRLVNITSNQYRAGVASYLNVITAQASLLSLERGAVDIQGRRLTASVQLIRALGGGLAAQGEEKTASSRP
jgi:NodT family efflux transporter outer membrane factor (OMF) lipoprotein